MNKKWYESSKLIENKNNLLDIIPGMILLLSKENRIEVANPAAIDFFGDILNPEYQMSPEEKRRVHDLFSILQKDIKTGAMRITKDVFLGDSYLELTVSSFNRHTDDNSSWIFIRNATESQKQLEKLSLLHNSIETILSRKILELSESEKKHQTLSTELNALKEHLQELPTEGKLVGSSRALSELREMVYQVAKSDSTILITGEAGTGKELVANLIRESSNRHDKPFLKINCSTFSENILESDLFVHDKEAFTDAAFMRKSKFEVMDGGTIFLDEIGDLSPRMQATLLRVLQDREIVRGDGKRPFKVNVRIIAATNRNLQEMVKDGSFRQDLFYRLNIINLSIPPLRERKEDIVDLTTHFVRKYRKAFRKEISFLPQPILDRLFLHQWPGNVRELENIIQRAVLMAKNNVITENELFFASPEEGENRPGSNFPLNTEGRSLKSIVADLEKKVITSMLKENRGNVNETAERLELGKTALYEKMKRYHLSAKEFKHRDLE
jgi:Nif-specific regulatory protein